MECKASPGPPGAYSLVGEMDKERAQIMTAGTQECTEAVRAHRREAETRFGSGG